MKEALGLSWRQGRKHGSLLRKVGVHLENEKPVRELSREIVSDFFHVEERSFLKEGGVEYLAQYGRILNLPQFVDSLLDSYDRQNMLTLNNGSIGGDHGKNSLKFTLQIANTEKPNARYNTVVIAIAAVKDTHDNIVRFIQGGLEEDLKALQSHSWRDKNIKVFLDGDYDFMCKIYGLSGPQGTYPCLWCLMPRRAMHRPSDQCQPRSLASLLADNKSFMQLCEGEKKDVAKFYNSLHAPMIDIESDRVSPLYLHILLGIVLKHHKLLEDAAHRLDTKIAGQADVFLLTLGESLKNYRAQWINKSNESSAGPDGVYYQFLRHLPESCTGHCGQPRNIRRQWRLKPLPNQSLRSNDMPNEQKFALQNLE
ncbi:amine oxidase [Plakobranchus ocellatus]|uniref:Amine oxidase n=1 Tax=Plakobranchus ocellatus TaxID=259542 RepID=A0AAV4DAX1_9GAST|nr:amine oxidase [Plakobranchus ocellatus]